MAVGPSTGPGYRAPASRMLLKDRGGNLDFNFGRRQERVVNQAVMHAARHAFGLLRGQRNRACDKDIEIAQPRRL